MLSTIANQVLGNVFINSGGVRENYEKFLKFLHFTGDLQVLNLQIKDLQLKAVLHSQLTRLSIVFNELIISNKLDVGRLRLTKFLLPGAKTSLAMSLARSYSLIPNNLRAQMHASAFTFKNTISQVQNNFTEGDFGQYINLRFPLLDLLYSDPQQELALRKFKDVFISDAGFAFFFKGSTSGLLNIEALEYFYISGHSINPKLSVDGLDALIEQAEQLKLYNYDGMIAAFLLSGVPEEKIASLLKKEHSILRVDPKEAIEFGPDQIKKGGIYDYCVGFYRATFQGFLHLGGSSSAIKEFYDHPNKLSQMALQNSYYKKQAFTMDPQYERVRVMINMSKEAIIEAKPQNSPEATRSITEMRVTDLSSSEAPENNHELQINTENQSISPTIPIAPPMEASHPRASKLSESLIWLLTSLQKLVSFLSALPGELVAFAKAVIAIKEEEKQK